MTETICKECGNKFTYEGKKKHFYCSSECQKEHARRMARWRKKLQTEINKNKCEKKKEDLNAINAKARELGMNYGQYVAMQYAKQVKVKRNV